MNLTESTLTALKEPDDYFKGRGQTLFSTPVSILMFVRKTCAKLQQKALQNRSHHRFVLLFNLQTEGQVHLDHLTLPFHPGEALLVFPYQFHHFTHLQSEQLQWIICTFEIREPRFLEPLRNQPMILDRDADAALTSMLESWETMARHTGQDVSREDFLQVDLLRLLLALRRGLRQTTPAGTSLSESGDNLVCAVNRLLSERRGDLHPGDIAQEAGLSESRLRALFRETAGVSLGSYLRNYRINRAMELLRAGRLPVADIATVAGFQSPQAFSRAFRDRTGQSPRMYRNGRPGQSASRT